MEFEEPAEQSINDLAQYFDQLYESEEKVWGEEPQRPVMDSVSLMKEGTVLDLGAGEGRNSIYLAQKGFEVIAADISVSGLKKIDEKSKKLGLEEKISSLNLDGARGDLPRSYDNIINTFTLHFSDQKGFYRMLENMVEHTEAGGLNVIEDFTQNSSLYEPGGRLYFASPDEIQRFYKEAGWELIDSGVTKVRAKPGTEEEAVWVIARKP